MTITFQLDGQEFMALNGRPRFPFTEAISLGSTARRSRSLISCVHRIPLHPSRPNVLFMQKHWDMLRSDDAGESWHELSGNLPSDFGFPIAVHAHQPEPTTSSRSRATRSISAGGETPGVPEPNRR